jgi:hypothetical protein
MYKEFEKILGENSFELCDLTKKEGNEDGMKETVDKITKCVTGSIKRRLKKD